MVQSGRFRFRYIIYISALIAIVILGRAETYFYGIAYTDVTYSDGLVSALEIIGYLFDSVKYGVVFAGICNAYWKVSKNDGRNTAIIAVICMFIENLARFLIDVFSGAAASSGYGVWVTLMSDGIQMFIDIILVVICVFIVRIMAKSYLVSEHPRKNRKYSADKCAVYSSAVLCLYQLISEISYDIDYLVNTDIIEGSSVAAMVGNFIFVVIFYGAIPAFVSILIGPALIEKTEKN